MSVMVIIRFPVAHKDVVAWADQHPALMEPIGAMFKKHGRISQRVVTSDSEFMDFDEWPSAAAYAAFKAEAAPYIEAFESAFGHRSVDTVYTVVA